MIINIAFDPENLKPTDEAFPAFQAGGLTLKVWALFKKHFITSQHFREGLVGLADYCERMHDIEDREVPPFANIDEFLGVLGSLGLYGGVTGPRRKDIESWAIRYWDYFSLSIQRQITLQFKAVREVTDQLVIAGIAHKSTEAQAND